MAEASTERGGVAATYAGRRGAGPSGRANRLGPRRMAGFSLIEVLLASGLLATSLVTGAALLAVSTGATVRARETSEAALMAWQKLEELRALAFTVDPSGMAVTDIASDTAADPARSAGGTGLQPSPAGVLDADTPGYVDYLDTLGASLGAGPPLPAAARYRRRWAILSPRGRDLLVIRVRVFRRGEDVARASMATVRVRRAP